MLSKEFCEVSFVEFYTMCELLYDDSEVSFKMMLGNEIYYLVRIVDDDMMFSLPTLAYRKYTLVYNSGDKLFR